MQAAEQSGTKVIDYPFIEDFQDKQFIDREEKGKKVRYVLLIGGSIARVREGKGKDVEQATMISSGDQSKYLSAMMAATIEIDGAPVIMEMLGDLSMKDYMSLQLAFADLNF